MRVADDGSTWASDSTAGRRQSHGAVAPIASAVTLRRRRVRGRRLCVWETRTGRRRHPSSWPSSCGLPRRRRRARALRHTRGEPPRRRRSDRQGLGTPDVTTDYQEGATMHLGARPAAREPVLDRLLERRTRLVSRGGALHPHAPADWHDIPRYESLAGALDAISPAGRRSCPATSCRPSPRSSSSRTRRPIPPSAGVAGGTGQPGRGRRPAPASRTHHPGGRAGAAGRSRRSRGRVVVGAGGYAVPVALAGRDSTGRRRMGGHDRATRRSGHPRPVQRARSGASLLGRRRRRSSRSPGARRRGSNWRARESCHP